MTSNLKESAKRKHEISIGQSITKNVILSENPSQQLRLRRDS